MSGHVIFYFRSYCLSVHEASFEQKLLFNWSQVLIIELFTLPVCACTYGMYTPCKHANSRHLPNRH